MFERFNVEAREVAELVAHSDETIRRSLPQKSVSGQLGRKPHKFERIVVK